MSSIPAGHSIRPYTHSHHSTRIITSKPRVSLSTNAGKPGEISEHGDAMHKTYGDVWRNSRAHICMEGVAIHWYTVVRESNSNFSWEVFKTKLLNRFGGITNLNPYEQLTALYQSDNVNNYIDHFETLAKMVPRESEALYLGYFRLYNQHTNAKTDLFFLPK